MKKFLVLTLAGTVLAAASGCVVTPPRVAIAAPSAAVYVAPTYASPGVGWVWEFHPQFGWGWHHPQYGWHRGWH
jgi:hypothetical protein